MVVSVEVMGPIMSIKTLLIAVSLLTVATAAQAVVIDKSSAIQGHAIGSGLVGTYYKAASGSTDFTIGNTLSTMQSTPVAGHFTATSLNYAGGDQSSITSFLGSDGASYVGRAAAANDLSDAILDLSGYLYVAAPSTISFALSHDDSAQLSIGNQVVLSKDCCGTDTVSVKFAKSGYYALDLIYSNTIYNNGVGGASVSLTQNGNVLTAANLAQSVPEPATWAVLGLALVGLGMVGRRKASQPTA